MEGYKSRIGKSQMRQYMGELYEDCMVVYREYIQNACDAIEDAVAAGLFPDRKKTTISVNIDDYNRTITIEDKGIGIPASEIGPCLVDVASSKKIGRAGQYGIGRLNGANYCDAIRYETSSFGEPVKSTLVWDVKKAREICSDSNQDPTTEEIIDIVTHLCPQESESPEEHYCKVTLINVNNEDLMDQAKVISYIQQIVPVDYTLEFKDNLLKPSTEIPGNEGFAERFKNLWIYKICVNDTPVEKPYSSVEGNFEFGSIRCFKLVDDKTQDEFAWGWYAMNKKAQQMNDLPTSFIRARHCNYQIGPNSLLAESYPSPVAPSYFIGELHLTHEQLKPTASRDGINQNATKTIFEIRLRKFFKELYTLYNKASKFRSDVVEKIAESDAHISSLSLKLKNTTDSSEKSSLKEKIKEAKDAKKKALDKAKGYIAYFEEKETWFAASDIIDGVNHSVIKNHNDKTEIIKGEAQVKLLKIEDFKPESSSSCGGSKSTTEIVTKIGDGITENTNPIVDVEPTEPNDTVDELAIYKGLSSVERKLIKKFYSVIDKTAEIPPKIKDKIKKNLSKKIL